MGLEEEKPICKIYDKTYDRSSREINQWCFRDSLYSGGDFVADRCVVSIDQGTVRQAGEFIDLP